MLRISRVFRTERLAVLALSLVGLMVGYGVAQGAEAPLHRRIDEMILATAKKNAAAEKKSWSPAPLATDAEFVRRIHLDLAGRIPTVAETESFLKDPSPGKRTALIDRLLSGKDYPRRMTEYFTVQLIERRGNHPDWTRFLQRAFETNRPWDVMARQILSPDSENEETRGAAYFYTKRLENYGQNPVDLPRLTRDVGRLFLGVDLQCAQCHNHLTVPDYKQQHYHGLLAFVGHLSIRRGEKFPAVEEKPLTKKVDFMSVFEKKPMMTGPGLPGLQEVSIPSFKPGEEFAVKPDRAKKIVGTLKFRTLPILAEQLPRDSNTQFCRNIVNRLWFQMMGRGLVEPLDLHHAQNPATHPELLDLLQKEFVTHKFDIRWLLRELALSQTYQRSTQLPEGLAVPPRESFLVGIEKPLSAEQLLWSVLTATGKTDAWTDPPAPSLIAAKSDTELKKPEVKTDAKQKANSKIPATVKSEKAVAAKSAEVSKPAVTEPEEIRTAYEKLLPRFVAAFGNPPMEPELEFSPSVKSALYIANSADVLSLLEQRPGNLADRLIAAKDETVADTLYMTVLSRTADDSEKQLVREHLTAYRGDRPRGVALLIWSLLASTEFCLNH